MEDVGLRGDRLRCHGFSEGTNGSFFVYVISCCWKSDLEKSGFLASPFWNALDSILLVWLNFGSVEDRLWIRAKKNLFSYLYAISDPTGRGVSQWKVTQHSPSHHPNTYSNLWGVGSFWKPFAVPETFRHRRTAGGEEEWIPKMTLLWIQKKLCWEIPSDEILSEIVLKKKDVVKNDDYSPLDLKRISELLPQILANNTPKKHSKTNQTMYI